MKRMMECLIGLLFAVSACSGGASSSGGGGQTPTMTEPPSSSSSALVAEGTWQTSRVTSDDLEKLGLNEEEIRTLMADHFQGEDGVVYSLKLQGGHYTAFATTDAGAPTVMDEGTYAVTTNEFVTTALDGGRVYRTWSLDHGMLTFKVDVNRIRSGDPTLSDEDLQLALIANRALFEAAPYTHVD
jgi:hypothetical protein